jgi:hypothetical protein
MAAFRSQFETDVRSRSHLRHAERTEQSPSSMAKRKILVPSSSHCDPCMVRQCVARVFRRTGVSGLASMYPAFDWSCFAPVHYGYQRACDLVSGQASKV